MFFSQCNSLLTFQAFMDSTFRDMITEGWLIIYMDDVLVFTETKEECQEWCRSQRLPMFIEPFSFDF